MRIKARLERILTYILKIISSASVPTLVTTFMKKCRKNKDYGFFYTIIIENGVTIDG